MKLGFPTHPRRDPCAEIARIAGLGFEFVDLFVEPDRAELGAFDPRAVRRALETAGIPAIGHTAWFLPIGSPMRAQRADTAAILRDHADAFAEMGIDRMTIHTTWPHPLFTHDEGIAYQVETLREVIPHAASRGVTILLESGDGPESSVENIAKLLDALPEVLFHADLGHLHLHGRDPADCVRRFADRLGHVHLHDNDGTADQHKPVGQGTIDWRRTIDALKSCYDGTITLEIFKGDLADTLRSRDTIRRLWN